MPVIIHKESSWTAEAKQPFVICLKMGQNNPYRKAINWLPAHLHLEGNVISLTNLLCHISLDNTGKNDYTMLFVLISPLTFFLIMTSREEWSVSGTATLFYLELVRTGYTFDLLNSPGYVCDLLQGCWYNLIPWGRHSFHTRALYLILRYMPVSFDRLTWVSGFDPIFCLCLQLFH